MNSNDLEKYPDEFNVHTAQKFMQLNKIEDWIYTYLSSGKWANHGLLNGLKQSKKWWIGPIELPLDNLIRKCGPEDTMEYRMPLEGWNQRVDAIAQSVHDPLSLPPLLIQSVNGKLMICDGNHRYESAQRKKWKFIWTLVWFDSEKEYLDFILKNKT